MCQHSNEHMLKVLGREMLLGPRRVSQQQILGRLAKTDNERTDTLMMKTLETVHLCVTSSQ